MKLQPDEGQEGPAADQVQPEAEQRAELAALEAAAGAGDQAPAAAAAPGAAEKKLAEPSAQSMMFAAVILRGVRPVAAWAVPSLRDAPADLWEPAIEGTAALLDHYGVSAPDSPWGRFAVGLMPLGLFVAAHSLAETDEKKADQVEGNQAPPALGAPDLAAPVPAPVVHGSAHVVIGAPQ